MGRWARTCHPVASAADGSDVNRRIVEVAGTATPPLVVAVMWVVALILLGVSAMHPSMRWLTEPQAVEAAHTITRTVLASVALLTPPVAILTRWLQTGEPAVVATVSSVFIALIVVARFAELVRSREQAQRLLRRQTLHDPLTGLPNRVLFADHLGRALTRRPEDRAAVGVAGGGRGEHRAGPRHRGRTRPGAAARRRGRCDVPRQAGWSRSRRAGPPRRGDTARVR